MVVLCLHTPNLADLKMVLPCRDTTGRQSLRLEVNVHSNSVKHNKHAWW